MNHIATALEPRREAALLRAHQHVAAQVDTIIAELKAANWDLDVVAPCPHGRMDRQTYKRFQAKRDFVLRITSPREGYRRIKMDQPSYVELHVGRLLNFYKRVEQEASETFTAYVNKLTSKIGETSAASINDSPLWNGSILTVTLSDGTVQRWKTTMIINVSCLGKLFNQWPTRRI